MPGQPEPIAHSYQTAARAADRCIAGDKARAAGG